MNEDLYKACSKLISISDSQRIDKTNERQRRGIKRELSSRERDAILKPKGFYHYFCLHSLPLWEPCKKCKRAKASAQYFEKKIFGV